MQNSNLTKKDKNSIGFYNNKNPLLNNIINIEQIQNYYKQIFFSQKQNIQMVIYNKTLEILQPIIEKQKNELNKLSHDFYKLYKNYIEKINENNIALEYMTQINSLENNFKELKEKCNSYENQSKLLNNYQKRFNDNRQLNDIILELDNIINNINNKENNENLMKIDDGNCLNVNDIENKLKIIIKKLHKNHKKEKKMNNKFGTLINNLNENIQLAQEKILNTFEYDNKNNKENN
jgi:hypothetical protein